MSVGDGEVFPSKCVYVNYVETIRLKMKFIFYALVQYMIMADNMRVLCLLKGDFLLSIVLTNKSFAI